MIFAGRRSSALTHLNSKQNSALHWLETLAQQAVIHRIRFANPIRCIEPHQKVEQPVTAQTNLLSIDNRRVEPYD